MTLDNVSLSGVASEFRETNLDTVAMVQSLVNAVSEEAGEYVHWGFTTTGITETAMALQLRETIDLLRRDLCEIKSVLIELAEEHKYTIMAARTHSQHALPYTFGLKAVIWAKLVKSLIERLDAVRSEVCIGKVVGAVGTALLT